MGYIVCDLELCKWKSIMMTQAEVEIDGMLFFTSSGKRWSDGVLGIS